MVINITHIINAIKFSFNKMYGILLIDLLLSNTSLLFFANNYKYVYKF